MLKSARDAEGLEAFAAHFVGQTYKDIEAYVRETLKVDLLADHSDRSFYFRIKKVCAACRFARNEIYISPNAMCVQIEFYRVKRRDSDVGYFYESDGYEEIRNTTAEGISLRSSVKQSLKAYRGKVVGDGDRNLSYAYSTSDGVIEFDVDLERHKELYKIAFRLP